MNFTLEAVSDSLYDFFEKFYDGSIVTYFCKPVKIYFLLLFIFLKPSKLIISFLFTGYLYYHLFSNDYIKNINCFLIFSLSIVIFTAINICFTFMLQSITIFSDKNLHIGFFQYHIMQLCFIPPTIYGEKLFLSFLFLIPTILSSAIPVLILVYDKIIYLYFSIFILIIMLILAIIIMNKFKKFTKSFGG